MTYCVALRLDAGMIFASDSRTNAGVDHIAPSPRCACSHEEGDRVIVVLSSGNLSITQNAITFLESHRGGDTTRTCGTPSRCSTSRASWATRCAR